MTNIVSSIPSPVMADSTVGGAASYTHLNDAYDYAIGGLPFISAADAQNPEVRKTAPYRKPPVDSGTEPGEQSLGFWWIKAQSSFHGGAGQVYIDTPVSQGNEIRPIRYATSAGLNPWTQGKMSLLKTTTKALAVSGSGLVKVIGSQIFVADNATLSMITETSPGVFSAPTVVTWGGTGVIQSLISDGTNWFVTDGTGIWKGTGTGTGASLYVLSGGKAILSYVKQRLMLGYTSSTSSSVYELLSTGAALALPAAKYTHPNPAWFWSCIGEGPGAIYATGFAGNSSAVFKFVLAADGGVPTLVTAIVVAQMPPSEQILAIYSYLATTISIVTTRGLRVGTFVQGASTGDFQYGPLTVTFPTPPASAAITGSDRFLFVTYTDASGVAGLARVDLSQQLTIRPFSYVPDQRYSFAPDLRATDNSELFVAGSAVSVDQLNGRMVFVVSGQGLFVEHQTTLTPSGSLTTSRIRYDTLDPKVVRYVRTRAEGTSGVLAVAVNSNADSGGPRVASIDLAKTTDTTDAAVSTPPVTFTTVTLSLTRSVTDVTAGPTCLGYQLKALPAQRKQRFIQLPLACFDSEQDSSGQKIGFDGSARSRLLALEEFESSSDVTTFQILSPFADNQYTALCVIEDIQFTQTSAPTRRQGWGGIIMLTIRTLG